MHRYSPLQQVKFNSFLDLVYFLKDKVWRGVSINYAMENPYKYHVNQMIKAASPAILCGYHEPLNRMWWEGYLTSVAFLPKTQGYEKNIRKKTKLKNNV